MAFKLSMLGSMGAEPASLTDQSGFSPAVDLEFEEVYDGVQGVALPINGTDVAPFLVPFGALTKVRAVAIRAVDGQSLVVKLTSAAGADQAVPVSGVLVVHAKNPGDQFTAVKVVGVGRIEYLVGGNLT